MDKAEIKQISIVLSDIQEGICEWDRGVSMQMYLDELYQIIQRLMDAIFEAKDRSKKIVLALLEKRAREFKAEIESRLAVRN